MCAKYPIFQRKLLTVDRPAMATMMTQPMMTPSMLIIIPLSNPVHESYMC